MPPKFEFTPLIEPAANGVLGRAPIPVLLLFIADIGFGIAHLITGFLSAAHDFFDLNREANLPTWYASAKWLFAALLFSVYAGANIRAKDSRSWIVLFLPILCVALSVDETAGMHERIGARSDAILPGGTRDGSGFNRTGIWMLVVGIPFIVVFGLLARSLRLLFPASRAGLGKVSFGMIVMLTGALGVETAYNFVESGSAWEIIQVFTEEMLELLGATIIVWGGYDLASRYHLTLAMDRAGPRA